MNSYASSAFISVSNLKSLIVIFEKFFKEKYGQYSFPRSLDIKTVIYETMIKINQNKTYKDLSKTELNKITLSIVKNVVKNRLETVDRPMINDGKVSEVELNERLDQMNDLRQDTSRSTPLMKNVDETDTALSNTEFMESLKKMELIRESLIDPAIAETFKNNLLSNPKDLFESSTQEHELTMPEFKEVVQERSDFFIQPEKKPDIVTKYICVDSRERAGEFLQPFHYTVVFEEAIRNISSVTLTYVLFNPDISGVDDLYVNLQIDELNQDKVISTNSHIKKAFAQLPIQGDRGVYDNALNERVTREFNIPLSVLNKFTISFVKYDGTYLETVNEHFIKLEVKHFNSIGGDLDTDTPNLNAFQNTLQEEIFMANDESEQVQEEL